MSLSWPVLGLAIAAAGIVPVALSYLVELLRVAPPEPPGLSWAPEIPVRHVDVQGIRIRYIRTGRGSSLVLLHTLRTQLDMFHEVIPELARHFTLFALDYPGHGFSEIPRTEYTPEFLTRSVEAFLEALDVRDATLVGESIGGSIALALAARANPRVSRVVAVNPYDYGAGRGIRRSSRLANVLFGLNDVPVLGSTVVRLRQYPIVRAVLRGGVARRGAIPEFLAREIYEVGNRPGHYRAFMSLLTHAAGWERARAEYPSIRVPVLLVYGDHDWSRPEERESNRRAIPGARLRVVEGAGHFLSLDDQRALAREVLEFVYGDRSLLPAEPKASDPPARAPLRYATRGASRGLTPSSSRLEPLKTTIAESAPTCSSVRRRISASIPPTGCPSNSVMMSPFRSPASSAGPPSSRPATKTPLSAASPCSRTRRRGSGIVWPTIPR